MTCLYYVPTQLPTQEVLTDLRTQFVSELLHKLTQLLEIKIQHASLEHPQAIREVERVHAGLTRIIKLKCNPTLTNWHNYLNLATFIHTTSYHTWVCCAAMLLFHGREPTKPLDIRFYSSCIQKAEFNFDFVKSLRDEMLKRFQNTKANLEQSFKRYRRYYDQDARANPMKEHEYCLLLNPKLKDQSTSSPKLIQKYPALYRVEKTLTKYKYFFRIKGTNCTQYVHRITLCSLAVPQAWVTASPRTALRQQVYPRKLPNFIRK